MATVQIVMMKRTIYLLRRKADGKFLRRKLSRWNPESSWIDDPNKARVFTNSGHARNAIGGGWNYRESRLQRSIRTRAEFDALYEIVEIRMGE